jgi:hypothetical protein
VLPSLTSPAVIGQWRYYRRPVIYEAVGIPLRPVDGSAITVTFRPSIGLLIHVGPVKTCFGALGLPPPQPHPQFMRTAPLPKSVGPL